MALVKKGPFFMAIKFELSLVITFMNEPCANERYNLGL